MQVDLGTLTIDDDQRRALNKVQNKPGLATRDEVREWARITLDEALVWDYDVRLARVVGPQRFGSLDEPTWFDMETLGGERSSMMDGSRMTTRHPRTGELAADAAAQR